MSLLQILAITCLIAVVEPIVAESLNFRDVICSQKYFKSSTREFAAGQGYNHVREHFKDAKHLVGALYHGITYHDCQSGNYNIDDFRLAANESWKGKDYLICANYSISTSQIIQAFRNANLVLHMSYLSPNDRLICAFLEADITSTLQISEDELASLSVFMPVPSIIKFDKSLHSTLHLGMNPSSEKGLKIPAYTDLVHPIHKDILTSRNVELSVILRRDLKREDLKSRVELWQKVLTQSTLEEIKTLFDRFYWTNEGMSTIDTSLSEIRRNERNSGYLKPRVVNNGYPHNSRYNDMKSIDEWKTDANSVHNDKLKVESWSRMRRFVEGFHEVERLIHLNPVDQASLFSSYCGLDNVKFYYRKRNIIISLHQSLTNDLLYGFHDSRNLSNIHTDVMRLIDTWREQMESVDSYSQKNLQNTPRVMKGTCLAFLSIVISLDPHVQRLALSKPHTIQNFHARCTLQNGGTTYLEPFSSAGLDGSGIVIGFSDTGVDRNHCMFRDDDDGVVKSSSPDDPFTDMKYRKVVQYIDFVGSDGDYSSGHGTHVAGTLAGYCLKTDSSYSDNINNYHGMAPQAKLAV
jgi:hypothetical protein